MVQVRVTASGAAGATSSALAAAARDVALEGCAVVRAFASAEEQAALKGALLRLVREWSDAPPERGGTFRTDERQSAAQGSEEYFMGSACKVRFFWEPEARQERVAGDPAATLLQLNKVGHGLHECDPVFGAFSHSDKVRALVCALGYRAPVLPQSMYIVKNPVIGGEVTAHQDATFLFTEPRQTCLGLWLALDDCELHNGCLWFRPGSHREPVRRHFCRVGDPARMEFRTLADPSALEGKSLGADPAAAAAMLELHGFKPVACRAGDLVVIHGSVEHLSLPNRSTAPRHSYQLHLVEGLAAGVRWSRSNWLQYPEGTPFSSL
jgi:phytanoyl-CoA hydroxylase